MAAQAKVPIPSFREVLNTGFKPTPRAAERLGEAEAALQNIGITMAWKTGLERGKYFTVATLSNGCTIRADTGAGSPSDASC